MEKIALIASPQPLAQSLMKKWADQSNIVSAQDANIIIVLGGDGMMLRTLREYPHKKIYGLHVGTVGFLMNTFKGEDLDELIQRIKKASEITLHPLQLYAQTLDGKTHTAHAINEVAIFRATAQAAKIAVYIDGKLRLEELTCDGILLATPAGSTAYNLSAHGPIIPLGANLLALTPISAFRPRKWRGALLPDYAEVELKILNPEHRRVLCSFDDKDLSDGEDNNKNPPTTSSNINVINLKIRQDKTKAYTLLFDPDHNLEDRIISEQFTG